MRITISGKPGSGKGTVSKLLADSIHYECKCIGDIMGEIAAEKGMSLLELSKKAETDKSIDEELDRRQVEWGQKKDNYVMDSRLGFYFMKNSFKVFLDVDTAIGAQRIFKMNRVDEKENTSLQATIKNIERRIKSERQRYKDYYNVDHYDMKHYDLVVDTSYMKPNDVVNKILKKIRKL